MTEHPDDVTAAAREVFLEDSGLLGIPAAEHAVTDIRGGRYDEYPMLRIARLAILAERNRCAEIIRTKAEAQMSFEGEALRVKLVERSNGDHRGLAYAAAILGPSQ